MVIFERFLIWDLSLHLIELPLHFPDIDRYWSKLSEMSVKYSKIFAKGKIPLVNPDIPLLKYIFPKVFA